MKDKILEGKRVFLKECRSGSIHCTSANIAALINSNVLTICNFMKEYNVSDNDIETKLSSFSIEKIAKDLNDVNFAFKNIKENSIKVLDKSALECLENDYNIVKNAYNILCTKIQH